MSKMTIPVLAVLSLVSVQCFEGPLEPVAPSWDISITVPLLARGYTVDDLLDIGALKFGDIPEYQDPISTSHVGGLLVDSSMIGDSTGEGGMDNVIDDETLADVNSGRLVIAVENGLPGTLSVKIALLDSSGTPVIWIPKAAGDSLRIPLPVIESGNVQKPVRLVTDLYLDSEEVRKFVSARTITYAIAVETPEGEVVNIYKSNLFNIRSWAELSYRVN